MAGLGSRIARQGLAGVLLGSLLALFLAVVGAGRRPRADFAFNNGAEVQSLDPAAVTGVAEGRVVRALYEGLTVLDPATLAPRPGMAERWEVSADGRTYTFHLRPDARWIRPGTDPARFDTPGDPLTATDFVRSWERLLHPATAAEYAYQLWSVRGARRYSELPEDRLYAGAEPHALWVGPEQDGRRRVGVTGPRLDALAPEGEVEVTARPGAHLAPGDAFAVTPAGPLALPVAGRVVAVRDPRTAAVSVLAADPYEVGWLVELEVPAPDIEAACAAGRLLSATAYRAQWQWPRTVGIRAPDEHTLVVELEHPTPYFLALTASCPLYPVHLPSLAAAKKHWPDTWETEWTKPAHLVTNGPFRLVERRLHDRIRLARNPVYWDAEHVAMGTIDVLAVEHQVTMLNLYLTGEVDWISSVPTNLVPRLLEREDFRPALQLGTYFYRVNVTRPPLDDARVRRALALAIDRRAICEKIMKAGQRPSWGFLPPGWPRYRPAELAHGTFAADCARARTLLAEAGFGPEHPLPPISLHINSSEVHRDIAEVVADGWRRELGVTARMAVQEFKVFLDTQRTLGYDVSRSSWMADFVDPVNFLNVFRSDGANNRTGWSDTRYDALLEAAENEANANRRRALLAEADALLMDELPLLPVFTYVTQNMVDPRLEGFEPNALDLHFLKFLRWRDDDTPAEEGR